MAAHCHGRDEATCVHVVPKLLEKSKGGVFVSSTEPSTKVMGLTVPKKVVLPPTTNTDVFPPT